MTLMHYDTNAKNSKNISQESTKTKDKGQIYKMVQLPMKNKKTQAHLKSRKLKRSWTDPRSKSRKASSKDPIKYYEKGTN